MTPGGSFLRGWRAAGLPRLVWFRRGSVTLELALLGIHVTLTAIVGWLWLALNQPGETFANPAWVEFSRHGSEADWAQRFLLASCFGLVSLTSRFKLLRLFCVFALAAAHGTVAYLFWLGTPPGGPVSTGTGTYLIVAGLGMFLLCCRAYE